MRNAYDDIKLHLGPSLPIAADHAADHCVHAIMDFCPSHGFDQARLLSVFRDFLPLYSLLVGTSIRLRVMATGPMTLRSSGRLTVL